MRGIEWRAFEAGYCTHPECATRRGAPLASARFPALAFLLRHATRGRLLFDTGYAESFFDATQSFPERLYRVVTPVQRQAMEPLRIQLARENIRTDDIACVIVSHLHGDHIAGLSDFPHSAVIASREGWEYLHRSSLLGALKRGMLMALIPEDFLERVRWIEECPRIDLPTLLAAFGEGYDLFGDGSLVAIALPGHAPGHYGLLFDDVQGEPVFLIADAAWSSRAVRENAPPPAFVTSWLGQTPAYRATLGRLHELSQRAPHVRIVPSHCSEWRP